MNDRAAQESGASGAAGTSDPPGAGFRVEVTRSARRRRSVGAQLVGTTLRLAIPSWMSRAEEQHWVEEMSRRFARKLSAERIDLAARARTLGRRHGLRRPTDIRWATDMTTRWGSCTPATGTIRISDRIASFPDWVIDYVIVHELCHLDVPGHGDDFWALVHRYPKAERAIGYLIAKAGVDDLDDLPDAPPDDPRTDPASTDTPIKVPSSTTTQLPSGEPPDPPTATDPSGGATNQRCVDDAVPDAEPDAEPDAGTTGPATLPFSPPL